MPKPLAAMRTVQPTLARITLKFKFFVLCPFFARKTSGNREGFLLAVKIGVLVLPVPGQKINKLQGSMSFLFFQSAQTDGSTWVWGSVPEGSATNVLVRCSLRRGRGGACGMFSNAILSRMKKIRFDG